MSNVIDINTALEILNRLLAILGNVSLAEAKTWTEVKENAERLRAEGHEGDESPKE